MEARLPEKGSCLNRCDLIIPCRCTAVKPHDSRRARMLHRRPVIMTAERASSMRRSTPEGTHRPVLLNEVMQALSPRPGDVAVDCTTGWAGHSTALIQAVGPTGRLGCLDPDPEKLSHARQLLHA